MGSGLRQLATKFARWAALVATLIVVAAGCVVVNQGRSKLLLGWYSMRLTDGDLEQRVHAARQLGRLGSVAVPTLIGALEEKPSASLGVVIVSSLGQIESVDSVDALSRNLMGLGTLFSESYGVALANALGARRYSSDTQWQIVDSLAEYLKLLQARHPEDVSKATDAATTVLARIAAQDPESADQVVRAIRSLEPERCTIRPEVLVRAFDGATRLAVEPLVRRGLAWVLGGLPDPAVRIAIVALGDMDVRDQALREIDPSAVRTAEPSASRAGARLGVEDLDRLESLQRCRPKGGLFGHVSYSHMQFLYGGGAIHSPTLLLRTWSGETRYLDMDQHGHDAAAAEVYAFGSLIQVSLDTSRPHGAAETTWRVSQRPESALMSAKQIRERLAAALDANIAIHVSEPGASTVRVMLKDVAGEWGEWSSLVVGLRTGEVIDFKQGALRPSVSHPKQDMEPEDLSQPWASLERQLGVCARAVPAPGWSIPIRLQAAQHPDGSVRNDVSVGGSPGLPPALRSCITVRVSAWSVPARLLGRVLDFTVSF